MNNITVGQIVGAMGTLTVIVGFFVAIFKWYKTNFTNKFNNIESRLKELEEKTNTQGKEMQESKEERELLLTGLLACLKALQEMGANGSTNKAIVDIEKFIIKKSHN